MSVIKAVVARIQDQDGRVLLLRRRNDDRSFVGWCLPGGKVDIDETVREALDREVFEETGINVDDVEYKASQPWPFPSSLMLGFRARAISTKINIDPNELEDARWFPKNVVRKAEASGLKLPRTDSIAYWLIKDWLAED